MSLSFGWGASGFLAGVIVGERVDGYDCFGFLGWGLL